MITYILGLGFIDRNQKVEEKMSRINQNQLKEDISRHLSSDERLLSIGVLKRVPSTGLLLLTKGIGWFLTEDFYVGVTDQRLIILPETSKGDVRVLGEDVIFADFTEVMFYTDAFNNTILDIHKIYKGNPLKLRFKPGHQIQGTDQFDFIAAVTQGKNAHEESMAKAYPAP